MSGIPPRPQVIGIAGPDGQIAGTPTDYPILKWNRKAVSGKTFPKTKFNVVFMTSIGIKSFPSTLSLTLSAPADEDSPEIYVQFKEPVSFSDGTDAYLRITNECTEDTFDGHYFLGPLNLSRPISSFVFSKNFLFTKCDTPPNLPLRAIYFPGGVVTSPSATGPNKNLNLEWNNNDIPLIPTKFRAILDNYGKRSSDANIVIDIQNARHNSPQLYFEFAQSISADSATMVVIQYSNECTNYEWTDLDYHSLEIPIDHVFYSGNEILGVCISDMNPPLLKGIEGPPDVPPVGDAFTSTPLTWTGVGPMVETEFGLIFQRPFIDSKGEPKPIESKMSNLTIKVPLNPRLNSPMLYFEFVEPLSFGKDLSTLTFIVVKFRNECTKGDWLTSTYYIAKDQKGFVYSNPTLEEYTNYILKRPGPVSYYWPTNFSFCAYPPSPPDVIGIAGPGVKVGKVPPDINPHFMDCCRSMNVDTTFALAFYNGFTAKYSVQTKMTVTIPASKMTCPEIYVYLSEPAYSRYGTVAVIVYKNECTYDQWFPVSGENGWFALNIETSTQVGSSSFYYSGTLDGWDKVDSGTPGAFSCFNCACNDGKRPFISPYCLIADDATINSLNTYIGIPVPKEGENAECPRQLLDFVNRINIQGQYYWVYYPPNVDKVNKIKFYNLITAGTNSCGKPQNQCCDKSCKFFRNFLDTENLVFFFVDLLDLFVTVAIGSTPLGILFSASMVALDIGLSFIGT